MLLVFCLTYPWIGGQSGRDLSSVSSFALKVARVFAALSFLGKMLKSDAPTSLNELVLSVFTLWYLDVNPFRLHLGPCL